MNGIERAERIAKKLRQEPYNFIKNDCLTKSLRFKRECKTIGIPARVVICFGPARARLFGRSFTIPAIHGWGEVDNKRIEVSRPLGSSAMYGVVPMNIKPVITVRF